MIVAGGLEANKDRSPDRGQIFDQAVIVRLRRQHGHPSTAAAFRPLDQHLLTMLGHVDRYQHGIGRSRKAFGHGRSRSKVLSRQRHFRDLLAGHDRQDGALLYAELRAPSANGRAIFPMCYGPEFIARTVREWIAAVGAKTAYIAPCSAWEMLCKPPPIRQLPFATCFKVRMPRVCVKIFLLVGRADSFTDTMFTSSEIGRRPSADSRPDHAPEVPRRNKTSKG